MWRVPEAADKLESLSERICEQRDAVLAFEREYLPSGLRDTPEWQRVRSLTGERE
jgi:hypothetical protein